MPKRSLILAGGGVKVAYQAGVLQVWLDEAGLTFDHADGASGGVFNLAMYCQGMTGKEMADNWRGFPVLRSVGLNWFQLMRFYWSESLLTYDKFRKQVLRKRWKLDWKKIRDWGDPPASGPWAPGSARSSCARTPRAAGATAA